MKIYTPNTIKKRVRIALLFFIVVQVLYVLAELATGYIFLPILRGGVMLSGAATILISCSSLALCLVAFSTIIDHYDKRNNEHKYKNFKKYCYKAAFILIIIAPCVQAINSICLIFGIHFIPNFTGLAENFTFYNPSLIKYKYLLRPILSKHEEVLWVSIPAATVAVFLKKCDFIGNERIAIFLLGLGCCGLGFLFLCHTLDSFLSGKIGGYRSVVYYASVSPAKFNAVSISLFSFAILIFFTSLGLMIMAILNPPNLKDI